MPRYRNNFDFVRLLAAYAVLVSHQNVLMGHPDLMIDDRISLGALGVAIFFTISGYLVTQSWLSDPHPVRSAVKRILRIWPALFVVTVIAALVVGPLVSSFTAKEYF